MTIMKLLIYVMKSNVQVRNIIKSHYSDKLGCVVRIVIDSILPHVKCGPNYHQKDAFLVTLYILVEQLETEGFNRTLFLSHLPPETISFFASLFARSQKDEYIYKLEEKLKQTENELKEMIEKRNHLELERIQLLDKVAELQIQLGMSFILDGLLSR